MARFQISLARLLMTPAAFGGMLGFLRPTTAETWVYALTAAVGVSGIVLLATWKTIVPIVLEFALGVLIAHACVVWRSPTLIGSPGHDCTTEMAVPNTWFGAIAGWSMAVVIVRAVPWVLHTLFRVRAENSYRSIEANPPHPPPSGAGPGRAVD